MDFKIKNKNALITGGSHGIGKSIALALADEGCNIAIFSRTKSRVDETIEELKKKNIDVLGMQADVFNDVEIENIMNTIIKRWGTIDILINNVGGGGRWGSENIEETDLKVWEEVYYKNVGIAIKFTRWAVPFMKKNKWGRVVIISSTCGKGEEGRPWFAISKSAEISFMKSMSKQKYLVRDGITFNTIAPGPIMIPDTGWDNKRKENPEEFNKLIDKNFPQGRLGESKEIGDVVSFVCSQQASLINGSCITIDGGKCSSF